MSADWSTSGVFGDASNLFQITLVVNLRGSQADHDSL
jgi:hypothetical protein